MGKSTLASLISLNVISKAGINVDDFYAIALHNLELKLQGHFDCTDTVKLKKQFGIRFELREDTGYVEGEIDLSSAEAMKLDEELLEAFKMAKFILT